MTEVCFADILQAGYGMLEQRLRIEISENGKRRTALVSGIASVIMLGGLTCGLAPGFRKLWLARQFLNATEYYLAILVLVLIVLLWFFVGVLVVWAQTARRRISHLLTGEVVLSNDVLKLGRLNLPPAAIISIAGGRDALRINYVIDGGKYSIVILKGWLPPGGLNDLTAMLHVMEAERSVGAASKTYTEG